MTHIRRRSALTPNIFAPLRHPDMTPGLSGQLLRSNTDHHLQELLQISALTEFSDLYVPSVHLPAHEGGVLWVKGHA